MVEMKCKTPCINRKTFTTNEIMVSSKKVIPRLWATFVLWTTLSVTTSEGNDETKRDLIYSRI